MPAIWYEAVLRWPGHFVLGATLPGCPLFAVARTERLAWGVTYLKGDTCDFFIEDCRPGGQTGWQFRRGNDWHDFQLRSEQIVRKGKRPTSEMLPVYFNQQGTLEAEPDAGMSGYYLSTAWIGTNQGAGRSIQTWLDVVAADGGVEGCAIAPGINLSMQALHDAAAKLPRIAIQKPAHSIGKDTVEAMQSGVFWGYIGLIEGLVGRIKAEWGKPMLVIGTGGVASLFEGATTAIDHFDHDLTIRGMLEIHRRNHNLSPR